MHLCQKLVSDYGRHDHQHIEHSVRRSGVRFRADVQPAYSAIHVTHVRVHCLLPAPRLKVLDGGMVINIMNYPQKQETHSKLGTQPLGSLVTFISASIWKNFKYIRSKAVMGLCPRV